MGLEYVELAMDAEEEFGISVPDNASQSVVTVGDFYDVVLALVREIGRSELRARDDLEEYLWSRVTALAAEHAYEVSRDDITRSSRFVEDLGYG